MNTKRLLIAVFAASIVAVAALSASTVLTNAEYDPHSGEKWQTDFAQAQQHAQSTDQPILVYFWSEDCQYCQEFNDQLQGNANLQNAADDYVMVSANYVEAEELRSKYEVSGTPTIVVLSPDGEQVTSFIPTQVDDPASKLEQAHEQARQ